MGGKKARKFFLTETHVFRKQKTMEKKVWKKCENTFFINTRISSSKNGGKKTREKFFQKHTNRVLEKCWKTIVSKKCEKMFFNKHINIVTKNGGKKSEKIFFNRNTRISQAKNDGKKSLEKVRKHVFL